MIEMHDAELSVKAGMKDLINREMLSEMQRVMSMVQQLRSEWAVEVTNQESTRFMKGL